MENGFKNPPRWGTVAEYGGNPTYTVGSSLDVTWTTDFDEYQVYIWQQSLQRGSASVSLPIFFKITGASEPGTFPWDVDPGSFSISQSNVFFMSLGPNNTLQGAFLSHYFNLTEAVAQTSSSSTIPITKSTTINTATQASTTKTSTTSTQSTTQASPSGSISKNSGPNVGLVLGLALGLGIPVILSLAFLAFKITQRRLPTPPVSRSIQVANSSAGGHPVYPSDQKYIYVPLSVEMSQGQDNAYGHGNHTYGDQSNHGVRLVELPTQRN